MNSTTSESIRNYSPLKEARPFILPLDQNRAFSIYRVEASNNSRINIHCHTEEEYISSLRAQGNQQTQLTLDASKNQEFVQ